MEASAHFLQNPKNSSSSQLVPITAMKDWEGKKKGGKKAASADRKDQNNFPMLAKVKN